MSEEQEEEYQQHYSPDGEYIEYQMEHPEEFNNDKEEESITSSTKTSIWI